MKNPHYYRGRARIPTHATMGIPLEHHPDNPPDAFPFKDARLRIGWLECLAYLEDSEAATMSYKGWLEAERDIGLDTLQEEGPEFLPTYIEYQLQIRQELWYLTNR